MDLHDYDEPVYVISVAADILEAHPQTLRMYERKGFVCPRRTDSQQRLYSARDLDDVREIRRLTRDLGVNLAGVEIILKLRRDMDELKKKLRDNGLE